MEKIKQTVLEQITISPEEAESLLGHNLELKSRSISLPINQDTSIDLVLGKTKFRAHQEENKLILLSGQANWTFTNNNILAIGRNYQSEFAYDNTMSRKHASIEYNDNRVIISDYSTNGTRIRLEKMSQDNEIDQSLADFANYAADLSRFDEDVDLIDKQIYQEYYTNPSPEQVFDQNVTDKYQNYVQNLSCNDSVLIPHKYWHYIRANKGPINRDKAENNIGRIYLNVNELALPDIFDQLTNSLSDQNVKFDSKIPRWIDQNNFNRADKMVVYFNSDDQQKVLDSVQEVYQNNHNYFRDNIPSFTAKLKDKSGQDMPGVSFGAEPINNRGHSFGSLRTKLLAELIADARQMGYNQLDFTNSSIKQRFEKICTKYSLDPTDLAFNSTNKKQFDIISDNVN